MSVFWVIDQTEFKFERLHWGIGFVVLAPDFKIFLRIHSQQPSRYICSWLSFNLLVYVVHRFIPVVCENMMTCLSSIREKHGTQLNQHKSTKLWKNLVSLLFLSTCVARFKIYCCRTLFLQVFISVLRTFDKTVYFRSRMASKRQSTLFSFFKKEIKPQTDVDSAVVESRAVRLFKQFSIFLCKLFWPFPHSFPAIADFWSVK